MKLKGVNYDLGTNYGVGADFRKVSKSEMIRDLDIIKNKLNCNAIRIDGEKLDKLILCSNLCFERNLTILFSPRFISKTKKETLKLIKKAAIEAEKLRKKNSNIIFVVGNEMSLDTCDFLKEKEYLQRCNKLHKKSPKELDKNLNLFLKDLVNIARKHFNGKITYASGFWENIDWSAFDFVGVNKYLGSWNKKSYLKELKNLEKLKKPIIITEFGCGSFKGASDLGPKSPFIIDRERKEIKGHHLRDENEQANYIKKLIKIFKKENIYGCFVFTFIEPNYKYSNDPKKDLDMASFNLVRLYGDGHLELKKSVKVIAKEYSITKP